MTPPRPQLWLASVAAFPPEAADWHDAAERALLRETRDPVERRRRAAGWTLRRWALTRTCPAITEAAWRFAPGHHGKPELAPPFDRLGLHHNLSHGGSYAAVLIAPGPCGADVEPPSAGLEAATVVFGPTEQADIAAHARPDERFLQHWVAKEAVLKLLGTGLGAAPERLQLALAPGGDSATPTGEWPALPPGLTVRLWPLSKGHWLAAALSGPVGDLQPCWAPWGAP